VNDVITSALPAAGTTWVRCTSCGHLLYSKRLTRNLQVCPECGHHSRLTARQRIEQLVDPGSFTPLPVTVVTSDVLGFSDTRPYPERLADARASTGLDEAVLCGTARLGDRPVAMAVMDFGFMGGSLGTAVGELITCTAETALRERLPLVIVTTSGGARMQEGVLSLMQMAKTSQAIAELREAGLLSVSVITDPTYGGVAASFAGNTDVLIAESGARMGFAGPRVIRQTIKQELPEGFQTARFLMRHGQLDIVADRRTLRSWLLRLLDVAGPGGANVPAADPVVIDDPQLIAARDPWEIVKLARQPDRPTTLDYISDIFTSFIELHGDRMQGDCPAIVAGLARLGDLRLAVIGHQKGHNTKDLVARNFGMAQPEGYRKALRVMRLAASLELPILTLVDTPGAYPGVAAEEHGQSIAIAQNIQEMSGLRTPIVTIVTGEGGSGGALALSVADRVLMLENATYSVISPEGCSSILWNTPSAGPTAARALRITARELLSMGVVDGVVPEPPGGAHLDRTATAERLRRALLETLSALPATKTDRLVEERRARFRRYGQDTVRVNDAETTRG
jgi:acetyl-CoA carboxylase carboxyl transferase alpha subunit/acetyl-CoA carboxylase carboxyl transferase beta subunit